MKNLLTLISIVAFGACLSLTGCSDDEGDTSGAGGAAGGAAE